MLRIRRPPRSTLDRSSAASDVYKRQGEVGVDDARLRLKQPNDARRDRIEFDAGDVAGGCLLYTSPSPRDRTRSRMPSSA